MEARTVRALSPECAVRKYAANILRAGFAATDGAQDLRINVVDQKDPTEGSSWDVVLEMRSEKFGSPTTARTQPAAP